MKYTFRPEERHAKASSTNLRISRKDAVKLCRVIRKKPLTRARRLLNDLIEQKRSLDGKYHASAANAVLEMLESCEKNAEFMGLDEKKLMVHASAHPGTITHRRRRRSGFGSRMKSTNLEIMLIESGRAKPGPKKEAKKKPKKEAAKDEKKPAKEKKSTEKEEKKEKKEAKPEAEKEAKEEKPPKGGEAKEETKEKAKAKPEKAEKPEKPENELTEKQDSGEAEKKSGEKK